MGIDVIILPALKRQWLPKERETFENRLRNVEIGVLPLKLKFGSLTLSGILLNPESNNKKVVIHCRGNGEFYQDALDEYVRDAKSLDCMVVAFNYPGVCSNETIPLNAQTLINSIIEVVNELERSYKLNSQDILLKGHSLGGALALIAAEQLHASGRPVYVFAGRTFSDTNALQNQASGFLSSVNVQIPPEWQMNVVGAYQNIPNKYKQFVNASKDQVITLPASLYAALLKGINNERREAMLDKQKQLVSHLLDNSFASFLSHQCPLDMLHNIQGQDGDWLFHQFVTCSFKIEKVEVNDKKLGSV